VVSLSVPQPTTTEDIIRPVNLRTDLGALADLIELVFADTMDSSGRAAIREMRSLSRLGSLNLVGALSELQHDLGYVYIADGRLIGNVSVYPVKYPRALGCAWSIANVAVHPDYRRRGIARRLMEASMARIQTLAAQHPSAKAFGLLQVDRDNHAAQQLYDSLGFVRERVWTSWKRHVSTRPIPAPIALTPRPYITQRRRGEWRQEYALAERVRPPTRGGVGWLRPLHVGLFRRTWDSWLSDLVNFRSQERLIIRADDQGERPPLLASLWIERAFAAGQINLTLLVDPSAIDSCADALINLAVRRFGTRDALGIEHPADETAVSAVLSRYQFTPQRSLLHMRWESG
jgi:GNAT superfamily N-acetyltransferase